MIGKAKIAVLCGVASWLAASAVANPTQKLLDCSEIKSDADRLKCFDVSVLELRELEPASQAVTVAKQDVADIERNMFGFRPERIANVIREASGIAGPGDQQMDELIEIEAEIESVVVHPITNKATISLNNGQIWEQTDTRTFSVSRARKAKVARLKRAALGSFTMKIDENAAIRVRRIK